MGDTPLTCYICGETEPRATLDMIGCLKDQEKAKKRLREKYPEKALSGYIDICPDCREKENNQYIKNIEQKYGIYK